MNEAEYLMKMSITRNIIQSENHRSEKKNYNYQINFTFNTNTTCRNIGRIA